MWGNTGNDKGATSGSLLLSSRIETIVRFAISTESQCQNKSTRIRAPCPSMSNSMDTYESQPKSFQCAETVLPPKHFGVVLHPETSHLVQDEGALAGAFGPASKFKNARARAASHADEG